MAKKPTTNAPAAVGGYKVIFPILHGLDPKKKPVRLHVGSVVPASTFAEGEAETLVKAGALVATAAPVEESEDAE